MREGFTIGPLTVHYYGVVIMFGVLAAIWLSMKRSPSYRQDPETVWDVLPWALIGGVIGARLWFLIFPSNTSVAFTLADHYRYYFTHPLDAIAVWNGGLGIPGAVIGGALGLLLFVRRKKMSFLTWVDIVAPGLILAQAIGRWGNFINQELYGPPSDLPWAITIDLAHRLSGYESFARYQPLFLYESLYNLLGMGLLLWLSKKYSERLKPGSIFLLYLIYYPVGRFLLEFLRIDIAVVGGININQTIMAAIAVVSLGLLIYRQNNPNVKSYPMVEYQEPSESSASINDEGEVLTDEKPVGEDPVLRDEETDEGD